MQSLGHPTVLLGAVKGEICYPPAVLGAWELCDYAQPLTAIADKYAVNETLELCVYAQTLATIADKRAVRECLGVAFPHRKKPCPLAHYERTNTPTRTL